MDKKYYYRDPLAAVWMRKYHEMNFQFISPSDGKIHTWGRIVFIHDSDRPLICDDRIYIHPDSLHLLEPQGGDLCFANVASNDGFFVYNPDKEPTVDKITQRQGKHFFWPEVEHG